MTVLPIVFLDVDGVLNPTGDPAGWAPATITFPADHFPQHPFANTKLAGQSHEIRVPPPEIAERLNALNRQARVVWCSTWEWMAATVFAPAAGLDAFEVLSLSAQRYAPRFGWVINGHTDVWKTEAAAVFACGAPFAIVDDNMWCPELLDSMPQATLAIRPDSAVGLTAEHLDQLDAFAAEHAPHRR